MCIQVADEASGRMLAAESAWYVRSQVIAHGPTVDRRHVFAARAAAERHAAAYYGRLLQGRQRPFARWLAAPAATAKSAATRQVSPKDAAAAAADVP